MPNMYQGYEGPLGPDPTKFNLDQLRAIANLLLTMGIKELSQENPDSPIYVVYDDDSERLYWRNEQT